MDLNTIEDLLKRGVVRVRFTKKTTGEERTMRCSRHPDLMPPPPPPKLDENGNPKPTRPMPAGHFLVWDVEERELKSFDSATLLEDPVLIQELNP